MTTLSFTLPVPPSANNLFVNVPGKGRVKSAEYKAWISSAGWLVKSAVVGKPLPAPPYAVVYEVPVDRRSDIANREKAASDLMVKLGLITDDKFIDHMTIVRVQRKDMLVTIGPYPTTEGRN